MPKLKISDLDKIKEAAKRKMILREGGENRARVTVHMATCGIAAGAREVMSALLEEIENKKVTDVLVKTSGCAGLCKREPMITVELAGQSPVKYVEVNSDKMRKIFEKHVLGGKILVDFALAQGNEATDKAQV